MDRVEAETVSYYLKVIQDWLDQYWVEYEPDPDYRIALVSLLHAVWPKAGKEEKPSYFPLPILCGQAAGKINQTTVAANTAWVLLFVASYLLDKIEDEEIYHPIFSKYSPGVVTNLTTGLILHSGRILTKVEPGDVSKETCEEITREFFRQSLMVCAGQHDDLAKKEPDFEQVWRVIDSKSGKFFALGAYLGARLAGADSVKVASLSEVGRRLGILNQMNNDLSGLGIGEETGSDLASGRRTLPAQYALLVLPPEKRAKLVEYLHTAVSDPTSEVEARRMIVSAGAVIYLSLEAAKYRQQAISLLDSLQLPPQSSMPLYNLINHAGTRISPGI